jgi:hypothetical protein
MPSGNIYTGLSNLIEISKTIVNDLFSSCIQLAGLEID